MVEQDNKEHKMPFPPNVKEDALIACGRCCCICHKFCGTKIEVHHIREESEGGDSLPDNAIALCFDCHADMRSYDHKYPKGNKYSESELKRHRDNWHKKVDGNTGLASRTEIIETDKRVYQVLVHILPWDGSISFVRTNNFAGFVFELSRLDDLHEYRHQCKNPAFEFIDPDLEELRATLLSHINKFTLAIATETFTSNTVGWNCVPDEWEIEQPERYEKAVAKIHDSAQMVVDTYESLVRTATRKLGILPDNMAPKVAK
jgi:hypothetical protein